MTDRVLIVSLAGCAISGTLLFIELTGSGADRPVLASAQSQVEAPAPGPGRPPHSRSDELVATILGRPVLSSTRKPPEPAKVERQAGREMPSLRLSGIIIAPDRHMAIFASPGAKPILRSEGEVLDGMRIEKIAAREVVFSGPEGSMTLVPKTDPKIVRPAAPTIQAITPVSRPAASPVRPAASPGQSIASRRSAVGNAPQLPRALPPPPRGPRGREGPAPSSAPARPPQ